MTPSPAPPIPVAPAKVPPSYDNPEPDGRRHLCHVADRSDAAARVELHPYRRRRRRHADARGGERLRGSGEGLCRIGARRDHIMFMGIGAPWEDGAVTVTLVFESGADNDDRIPVRIGADNASEMDDGS